MSGWGLFWVGLGTAAFSLWFAWGRTPRPQGGSWWQRSSRSYADWKGSWASVTVPLGFVMALLGLVLALTSGS
jgi:hypothetical protein